MPKAVRSTLLLYADYSCILHQHKNFENICDWLVDNKLSTHFGKNKTKSILFAGKQRSKNFRQLNIRYNHINIKQHSQVTYLTCILDKMNQ